MKLKNIFFALIIACTFAACSSDSTLDELTNGNPTVLGESSTLAIKINAGGNDDKQINNWLVVLANGDNIFVAEEGVADDWKIFTEGLYIGSSINVYTIANVKKSDFTQNELQSVASLKNKVTALTQNSEKLIKVGKQLGYILKSCTSTDIENCNNKLSIEVEQISARIDFAGLKVNFTGGNNQFKFRLTGVELENVQNSTKLYSDERADSFNAANLVYNLNGNKDIAYGSFLGKENEDSNANPIATLYTFANNNQERTTKLVIKGDILKNGEVYETRVWTVEVNIDNEGVKRGNLYEIYATLTGDVTRTEVTATYQVSSWNSVTVDVPSFN